MGNNGGNNQLGAREEKRRPSIVLLDAEKYAVKAVMMRPNAIY